MLVTTPDPHVSPPRVEPDDPWLSLRGAAAHGRLHPETLRRAAAAGRLRAVKIGGGRIWRTRRSWVDAWIAGGGDVL